MQLEMNEMSVPQRKGVVWAEVRCYVLVAVAVLVMGLFAGFLNHSLYQHQAPFFDSMSYHEQCFRAMHDAKEHGLATALIENMQGTITVCLPQAIAIVASVFVEPSRYVGIAIQGLFLLAFEFTLLAFFRTQLGLGRIESLCGCLLFLAPGCLMLPVGGLSDFRMDLLLMLNLSTCSLLVMMALATTNRQQKVATWLWLIAGAAIAATCLCRATAPVYLVAMLGPVILLTVVFNRKTLLSQCGGMAIGGVVAACGCLWFYIINFDHLKYYYVEWNTDANAALSWFESLGHLRYVRKALGVPLLVFFLVGYLSVLFHRDQRDKLLAALRQYRHEVAALAWIGLMPIAILVAKRAGMNPFVSMPAVFGIVAVLLIPLLAITQANRRRGVLGVSVVTVWGVSLLLGYTSHTRTEFDSMKGRQDVLRAVALQSDGNARLSVVTLGKFNTSSLMSTLLFDVDAQNRKPGLVRWQNVNFRPKRLFQIAAKTEWDSVYGANDREKVESMFQLANRELDFVVIPTRETAAMLSLETSNRIINRQAEPIRKRFLESPSWSPVSNPIEAEPGQRFVLLKRIDQVANSAKEGVKRYR